MALSITSTAFTNNGEIPATYTCQGEDISPPLQWSGVQENAVSLVLIVDDPDAAAIAIFTNCMLWIM